jgi:FxsC-like protein
MEGLVLYFFVSYANGDDDPFVEKFFDDLAREIRSRDPAPDTEEVGFLDVESPRLGARWSPRLNHALSTCGCFVALCSPRYFVSEFCGKEWRVFEARVRQYERRHGHAANALLPLMWLPMREVHPAAAEIQYRSRSLGHLYQQHGLRSLMRLKRFEDDYLLFTISLAQHIVDTARSHPLPPPPFGLDSDHARSAFHPAGEPPRPPGESGAAAETAVGHPEPRTSGAGGPVAAPPDEPDQLDAPGGISAPDNPEKPDAVVRRPDEPGAGDPGVGSPPAGVPAATGPGAATAVSVTNRRVHFVIAVGRQEELSQLGRNLYFYGEEFHEWAPYRPRHDDPLAVLARTVAAERLFESEIAGCEELLTRIDRANRENHVVVLLVDAWAARVRRVGDLLYRYDQRNEPTTGVMIPMNVEDRETLQRSIELNLQLGAVFPRNVSRRDDLMFRQSVPSSEAFGDGLKEILEVAQNRMFTRGTLYPQFDVDLPAHPSPILEGPSAEGKE